LISIGIYFTDLPCKSGADGIKGGKTGTDMHGQKQHTGFYCLPCGIFAEEPFYQGRKYDHEKISFVLLSF